MDHMTQVGPIPLPLLDELDLASNTVLCTLLHESSIKTRLVVPRPHPQPDSLRKLDGGRLSQFDGPRKQQAHAVVRHIDYLPHDQAVRATHPTGRKELAPWIQAFKALLFRHCRDLDSPIGFHSFNETLIYPAFRRKQSGKTVNYCLQARMITNGAHSTGSSIAGLPARRARSCNRRGTSPHFHAEGKPAALVARFLRESGPWPLHSHRQLPTAGHRGRRKTHQRSFLEPDGPAKSPYRED